MRGMKLGNKDKTKLTKRIIICKYDFIAYLSIKYATIKHQNNIGKNHKCQYDPNNPKQKRT